MTHLSSRPDRDRQRNEGEEKWRDLCFGNIHSGHIPWTCGSNFGDTTLGRQEHKQGQTENDERDQKRNRHESHHAAYADAGNHKDR